MKSTKIFLCPAAALLCDKHRFTEMRRVNISGTHIFLAIAAGLCMAGPFTWIVIKYWLFAV